MTSKLLKAALLCALLSRWADSDAIKLTEPTVGSTDKSLIPENLMPGARAKYIAKQLKALKTKEEKIALYKRYKETKIITKEVEQQIEYLMKN